MKMAPSGSADRQQLFEESAKGVDPIDEVDFQNPVAHRAVRVEFAQSQGIAMANRKASLCAGVRLVREVTDEMPGSLGTEIPTGGGGEFTHVVVQRTCSQFRVGDESLLALAKRGRNVVDELVLAWVRAQDVGAAEVSLPGAEQRPKIKVHDIIGADAPIGRRIVVGENRVLAAADDAFVPMASHAEAPSGERADFIAEFAFKHSGPYELALDYLGKELLGLVLCGDQRFLDHAHSASPGMFEAVFVCIAADKSSPLCIRRGRDS
jgi:hypothetical protein